ncbi:unnamed protein product [Callosobruchus maculatus]|nr:unnamed protein product [Callosobruchus maculatus]
MVTLLMKGKIPRKEDLRKTICGIVQSTAFLSGTGFGYSLFLCSLRRVLGNFNILTVSAIPAFLSSVFSILIERPSRRTMLCLYVSNVATETLWNMARARHLVRDIRYGDAAIYSASIAMLLYYFKKGYHKSSEHSDAMYRVIRFVVGPYEEYGSSDRSQEASRAFYRQVQNSPNDSSQSGSGTSTSTSTASGTSPWRSRKHKNSVLDLVNQMLRAYKRLIYKIKCCDRHSTCPHPFSCLYYVMQGAGKMFSVGLGLQVFLKLILNSKRILSSPANLKQVLFKKQTLNLAVFLGAFSGIFRGTMCTLRNLTGKDRASHAIPAGILAGIAYLRYPDTTVALYVMWKAAQISYNLGIEKGLLPKVPGFVEFLYCFSTAILFHAAILEPTNLRPSYWKFLHSISGGRIACMSRQPLEVWGLNTTESLKKVLEQTKTVPVVYF